MKKHVKKLLSIFLAVLLVFNFFPNDFLLSNNVEAEEGSVITYLFNKSTLDPGTLEWHLIGAPYGEITPGVSMWEGTPFISIDAWQDGHARSFGFYVPMSGSYNVILRGQLMDMGGISRVYIDNNPIGIFDFYDPATMANQFESEETSIALMDLEAGMHELKFEAIGHTAGSWRRNMHPSRFILDPTNEQVEISGVSIEWDEPELYVGTETQLLSKGILNNGSKTNLIGAQVEYFTTDETIAIVDSQSGLLSATGIGETIISATVIYKGITYTDSLPITVQAPRPETKVYLFNKASLDPGTPEWHLIGAPLGEISPGVNMWDGTPFISIDASQDGHARSFEFKVPAAGTYFIKMQGQLMDMGGISRLYVDDKPIGIFDFYDPVTMADQFASEVRSIAIMNLEAGMHKLTLEAIGHTAGSWRRNMHPIKLILDPGEGSLEIGHVSIKWNSPVLYVGSHAQFLADIILADGTNAILPDLQATFQSADENIAIVDPQTGLLEATGIGQTTISASLTYEGETFTSGLPIEVIEITNAKSRSTYYTEEKVQAARANVSQYDWARGMKDSAVEIADMYIAQGLDFLWNLVPPQSLPRSCLVNFELGSPITGREVDKYGNYPYIIDPINQPWKIKDPSSGYFFPTNDFKSYYESGLNENGIFDKDLADPAYLVNTLYPEKGETWGVDDGFGWIDENGNYYTFIAYYVHWLWGGYDGTGEMREALNSLRDAYLYTGDLKYARAGTVMLDRIADVYPSLDISIYGMDNYFNSHGFTGLGKAIGNMWEPFLIKDLLRAYDAFYPAMDDPELIQFLSEKSQTYDLGPLKRSVTGIRKNIESGIVEQVYPGTKTARMAGNNGVHQSALALAAVVYDKLPETKEWLDFNFASGGLEWPPYKVTGGNMGVTFVNEVDRDGAGNESAASYNMLWLNSYLETADILDGYDGYPGVNLYDHVKFRKMFSALYPMMLSERYTANVGDASRTGNPWLAFDQVQMIKAFEKYGDPMYAQLAYFINNNTTSGLHGNIFTQNPEQIVNDIQVAIDEHGLLDLDSVNMTGYGFAALRDGVNPKDIYGIRYPFQQMQVESMSLNTNLISRGAALEFQAQNTGDSIKFKFNVETAGEYEVLLQPARSIFFGGYGIYQVKLDGQPVCEMDFFGTRQERESLGTYQLGSGDHNMEFISIGKNQMSRGYKMGLLELALLDDNAQQERNNNVGQNTLRDLWLYYGRNYAHGHGDNLNIGLTAFGLDLSPDLGYPESTLNTDTHNTEWVRNTISHNTVVVDQKRQNEQWVGMPKQFDDKNMVKLIDVEAPYVYPQTELYKRTSAMINVDSVNSYVIDFFRVKGGSEHHFSFHGAEGNVTVEGLNMIEQPTGSYEGPDVEYGIRPSDDYGTGSQYVGSGFHYLKNVERDTSPSSQYSIDWAINDTWNVLAQPEDIHLRLTMLGDADEVALADGIPSRTEIGNPESLRYMIAKRAGTDLNSTFTSVIEPYKDQRFVSSISPLTVKAGDAVVEDIDVRAVKVTLANGRIDYIISALNPDITYTIDDKLQFKGCFGVYSEINGQQIYSYVNDGTVIGQIGSPEINAETGNISGTVVDFTEDLQINNEIIVEMNIQEYPVNDLINRSIYVEDDGIRNAVYTIKGVTDLGNGLYALDIGDTTLIRSYIDDHDYSKGYVYDIAEDANFRIPLSYEKGKIPEPEEPHPYVPTPQIPGTSEQGQSVKIEPGIITVKPVVDAAGKSIIDLTDEQLNSALDKNKDSLVIEVETKEGLESVAIKIPAQQLLKGLGKKQLIQFKSELADIILTMEELGEHLTLNSTSIELIISRARDVDINETIKAVIKGNPVLELTLMIDGEPINYFTNRKGVEVSIPYTLKKGANPNQVVVYYITPNGNLEVVRNGKYDTSAGMVTFYPEHFSLYAIVVNKVTFDDIKQVTWAIESIEALASREVILGMGEGKFLPNKQVTRAEFIQVLIRTLELSDENAVSTFTDVKKNDWYYESVSIAQSLGIVEGKPDGTFGVNEFITRQDMAVMIERAISYMKVNLGNVSNETVFSDSQEISGYAIEAVERMRSAGLINGMGDGRFAPKELATRAQAAVILYSLFKNA